MTASPLQVNYDLLWFDRLFQKHVVMLEGGEVKLTEWEKEAKFDR